MEHYLANIYIHRAQPYTYIIGWNKGLSTTSFRGKHKSTKVVKSNHGAINEIIAPWSNMSPANTLPALRRINISALVRAKFYKRVV